MSLIVRWDAIYLGVEKRGIVEQLDTWYGDLGIPIVALGGYSSQTYEREVIDDVETDTRPAVVLYAGDFDPSGEDIDRNFIAQTDCWATVLRVALTAEQVEAHGPPPQPGKTLDSRAEAFTKRHGRLVAGRTSVTHSHRLTTSRGHSAPAGIFESVRCRDSRIEFG
jgi:hypothetical protein